MRCEKCGEASTVLTRGRHKEGFAGDMHVCDDCLADHFKWCFECNDWVEIAEFPQGSYVCNNCTAEIAAEREEERVTV